MWRKRKRKSRGQAGWAQQEKERQRARSARKKKKTKETNFVGRTTWYTGGEIKWEMRAESREKMRGGEKKANRNASNKFFLERSRNFLHKTCNSKNSCCNNNGKKWTKNVPIRSTDWSFFPSQFRNTRTSEVRGSELVILRNEWIKVVKTN